ncbi:hypothetical protein ACFSJW_07115 [Flavobacterium artemisiae]|uniref:SCP-2 sterol transfer family protein n=1 Tax=Flavobacterium artemisiae TaxID=2126556 RepID=A0ABW4HD39_9FLAO
MSNQLANIGALKDFLEANNISISKAQKGFECNFKVVTPNNNVEIYTDTRITFTGNGVREGEVIILEDLPAEKYPTNFIAGFGKMDLVGDDLIIEGIHKTIGAYKATLFF